MKNKKNTILIVICSLLTSITIFISIETSVNGMQISKLGNVEKIEIEKKKKYELDFVKLGSIRDLEAKSISYGFNKTDDFLYIKVDGPVALSK